MPMWFDTDGQANRIGIYSGDDDAPMANPRAHLGRTKLHTDFNYLPFVPAKRIAGDVTAVASISDVSRGPMRRTLILAAHGMGGVPFIYGYATISGVIRPMVGTIPIMRSSTKGSMVTWTLGVDATNVFISEARSYPQWGSSVTAFVEVYVSNKLVI